VRYLFLDLDGVAGGGRMKTTCECVDPACVAHSSAANCDALGLIILFSADVPDHSGTLMCASCRDRALESGRYDAGRLAARAVKPRWS
jgi:hypothetical protein